MKPLRRDRLTTIERLFRRDGARCAWCSKQLTRQTASIDHVRPRSKRGSHWPGNLILACLPCNQRRGAMSVTRFARKARAEGQLLVEAVIVAASERQSDQRTFKRPWGRALKRMDAERKRMRLGSAQSTPV
jgi:hypothetical protein